jgi:hypothetical protein
MSYILPRQVETFCENRQKLKSKQELKLLFDDIQRLQNIQLRPYRRLKLLLQSQSRARMMARIWGSKWLEENFGLKLSALLSWISTEIHSTPPALTKQPELTQLKLTNESPQAPALLE